MALCETCNQWYHAACIGMTLEELDAEEDWKCGYCREKPGHDGMCEWKLDIPQGKRKRSKVAPARAVADTPRARGVDPEEDDLRDAGPRSWDDAVALAKSGGKAINVKMLALRKRAEKIVKEEGHHVVDEMGAVGLQARGVDGPPIDDLIGQDMLAEDDDPEGDIAEEDDSG